MLTFLLIGTAYSEQLPNKPFKVCPNPTKPADYPCVAFGPTATIAHRSQSSDKVKVDILERENQQLKELVKALEKELADKTVK